MTKYFRFHLLLILVATAIPAAWATQEAGPLPASPVEQTREVGDLDAVAAPSPANASRRSGPVTQTAGPIAPAGGQPSGALSGRIVYTSAGHGWVWSGTAWAMGRPILNSMN